MATLTTLTIPINQISLTTLTNLVSGHPDQPDHLLTNVTTLNTPDHPLTNLTNVTTLNTPTTLTTS